LWPHSATTPSRSAREWGERRERELLLSGPKLRKKVPTLATFAPRFMEGYARANRQKASSIAAKDSILRLHLISQQPNLSLLIAEHLSERVGLSDNAPLNAPTPRRGGIRFIP